MPNNHENGEGTTVDLTTLVVGEKRVFSLDHARPSLLWLAHHYCRTTLDNLRALNPHLAHVDADEPLALHTRVQLPHALVLQRYVDTSAGGPIALGAAESRLRRCTSKLDGLVSAHEQQTRAPLPTLPKRRVLTELEQLRKVIDAEAERQLPLLKEASGGRLPSADTQLGSKVDVSVVQRQQREVSERFRQGTVRLHSFRAENATALRSAITYVAGRLESHLCPADMAASVVPAPGKKASACKGKPHTHRWEFSMCRRDTLYVTVELACVLCQPLTALMDAMNEFCAANNTNGNPFPPSQNGFLFIGGIFYVDDRHSEFTDLTEPIRNFHLPLSGPAAAKENEFKRCPVRSAHQTLLRDVTLVLGDLYAMRHHGDCTHYFYLKGVSRLTGSLARRSCEQYPVCTARTAQHPLLCQACRAYPASVALYNDPVSPTNPALYCPLCSQLLHGEDSADVQNSYVKLVADGPCEYFRCP